jgi:hypothetical protein
MERRRPNRELKNTEDVQDALIEDYFRYNDLSRMEADDILMNSFFTNTTIEVKKSVITFMSLFVFVLVFLFTENNIMSAEQHSVFQNFIIRVPPSFGGHPPYSNHSVRPHFLSYNNS